MPGLVGIVSTRGERVNLDLMQAMRDAIRHRDWYEIDDYVSPKGTVAVSRVHLGIINKGRQPYSARDGRVKIFLHGEIYNDQVAHADPLEFIHHLYEKNGLNFASFLNGSFVIVIVDEDEDVVLIANDRTAAKPLFYFNDGRAIYFGPEIKSLFLVASVERRLNLVAVADFLATGFFTREHTLIEGLETVDNATVLKITASGVARHKYWKFDIDEAGKDHGLKYYQETLAGLLRKAVSRCLRTDNTYGILLSGGYDSRGILGCFLEERGARELHTISWGREEDIPNSDCVVARRLAQKLDADHRFYKRPAEEVFDNFHDFILLGEGLTDDAASYGVYDRIRKQQGVDILLRGDECFGWPRFSVHDEYTVLRGVGIRALQNIRAYQRILKPSYHQLFCELNAETIRHVSSRCNAKNKFNRMNFFHLDVRIRRYLGPLNYIKTFVMESFTPFIDYDILDFVSTLPGKYTIDRCLEKKTVTEMFPELFEEEISKTGNWIDWAASFRSSPELERFVYRELIEEQNVFNEFIDIDSLKRELDAFFAFPSAPSIKTRMRTGALKLLGKSPAAYNFANKCSYYVQKQRGRVTDSLPIEKIIMRLLILKVWGGVFLSYPVVSSSK